MKHLLSILLYLVAGAALGGSAWQYSDRVERSMVVTGTIEVDPEGAVRSYTLDQQNKLLPEIVQLIARTVPTWKFKPIVGGKSPVTATMSIRVIADKLEGDRYALSIKGESFGTLGDRSDGQPNYRDKSATPRYPHEALRRAAGAVVYVAAFVNRQGLVEKVGAMQVDLRAMDYLENEAELDRLRKDFAQASLEAIAKWTFNIPYSGPYADADHWIVRIPVNFQIVFKGKERADIPYGYWDAYVPGPVNRISWVESDNRTAPGSADAIPDNGIAFLDDRRFVLLNPPSDG